MCVCVCVCVCVSVSVSVSVCVDGMKLKYAARWHIHISVHSVLCQCIHVSTHILKAIEDSEPAKILPTNLHML